MTETRHRVKDRVGVHRIMGLGRPDDRHQGRPKSRSLFFSCSFVCAAEFPCEMWMRGRGRICNGSAMLTDGHQCAFVFVFPDEMTKWPLPPAWQKDQGRGVSRVLVLSLSRGADLCSCISTPGPRSTGAESCRWCLAAIFPTRVLLFFCFLRSSIPLGQWSRASRSLGGCWVN